MFKSLLEIDKFYSIFILLQTFIKIINPCNIFFQVDYHE